MTVASERIERLWRHASEAAAAGRHDRAREYVRLARRVAEREREPLPAGFTRRTCDACDAYLRPGVNARVRLRDGHVAITCDCGHVARYPYR
jgi:ribonuclease P protein subunit RPR2